jgi:hypothetical protein
MSYIKNVNIELEKNITRVDLVNFFIKKYKFKNYLEIGCYRDLLFSKVQVENKVGVDPFCGGTIRLKSDNFFWKINFFLTLFLLMVCIYTIKLEKI